MCSRMEELEEIYAEEDIVEINSSDLFFEKRNNRKYQNQVKHKFRDKRDLYFKAYPINGPTNTHNKTHLWKDHIVTHLNVVELHYPQMHGIVKRKPFLASFKIRYFSDIQESFFYSNTYTSIVYYSDLTQSQYLNRKIKAFCPVLIDYYTGEEISNAVEVKVVSEHLGLDPILEDHTMFNRRPRYLITELKALFYGKKVQTGSYRSPAFVNNVPLFHRFSNYWGTLPTKIDRQKSKLKLRKYS